MDNISMIVGYTGVLLLRIWCIFKSLWAESFFNHSTGCSLICGLLCLLKGFGSRCSSKVTWGVYYCRGAGCKEWSRTAAGSPWVTASVACSGSRLGSVRMAVVVLKRRSELRTTEENMWGKSKNKLTILAIMLAVSVGSWDLQVYVTHWVLEQAVNSADPSRSEWIDTGPPHWQLTPFHYMTQTAAPWWYWTDTKLRKDVVIKG